MPERIQLRRTKGWRKLEGTIVVARGTDWGNPFVVGQPLRISTPTPYDKQARDSGTYYGWQPVITPAIAVLMYRVWIETLGVAQQIRDELGGRDLACWCPIVDENGNRVPCHADVLLEIANA